MRQAGPMLASRGSTLRQARPIKLTNFISPADAETEAMGQRKLHRTLLQVAKNNLPESIC